MKKKDTRAAAAIALADAVLERGLMSVGRNDGELICFVCGGSGVDREKHVAGCEYRRYKKVRGPR